MQQCNTCSASQPTTPLSRCNGCNAAWYCSRDHQKADWPKHRILCQAIGVMRENNTSISKSILTLPPETVDGSPNCEPPRFGDHVSIQYEACRMNGEIIGSTKGGVAFAEATDNEPFSFLIGAHHVIQGLEQAVTTMLVGEVSRFIFAPDVAFGEPGIPGVLPARAFVIYDVELLNVTRAEEVIDMA